MTPYRSPAALTFSTVRGDVGEEVLHHATGAHGQLAADEVHGLDAVGALVDGGDAGIAEVLGDAGLLDVAHPAEDLDGGGGDLDAEVGAPSLADGDEEVDAFLSGGPGVLVLALVGMVDAAAGPVDEAAQRLELRLHGEQHPADVGMLDDRRLHARLGVEPPALEALVRVLQRVLVGAVADGEALQTDREAGVVHHREHVRHAPVLLTDEVAGGLVVVEDARGAGLDAELVLDRLADHAVLLVGEIAVVVEEELGDDEARDALGAGRGVGRAGQHEVDDVVGHVVLAPRDPDLRAGDLVGAVVLLDGTGAHCADVGAGLGLGEVHGARPLARHHLGQPGLALDLVAVDQERVDRALGQQRRHRERFVRRREHLLHGDADQPGEPSAAVGLGEGHAAPAGRHVVLVRRDESLGRGHGVVLVPDAALLVADAVERGDLVLHEPGALLEHRVHGGGLGVVEALERGELAETGDAVQDESDVVERGGVVGHDSEVTGGYADVPGRCARVTPGTGSSTVKRQPGPRFSTRIVPSWASTRPLGDGEAEPSSTVRAGAGRVTPEGEIEDPIEVIDRDARRTRRRSTPPPVHRASSHATWTSAPDGVWRMALSSRLRTTRVSSAGAMRSDCSGPVDEPTQADALGPRHRRGRGDRLRDDIAQRHGLEVEVQRTRLDPAELEEIVDEHGEAVGLPSHGGVVAGDVVRVVDHAVLERLDHRPDAGQRRPQVVGDPRDQLASSGVHRPLPGAGLVESFGGEPELVGETPQLVGDRARR